jgi:hypothetical protein
MNQELNGFDFELITDGQSVELEAAQQPLNHHCGRCHRCHRCHRCGGGW